MAEDKKPMNVTQQKESQGKEKTKDSKARIDSHFFKETVTVQKIS